VKHKQWSMTKKEFVEFFAYMMKRSSGGVLAARHKEDNY